MRGWATKSGRFSSSNGCLWSTMNRVRRYWKIPPAIRCIRIRALRTCCVAPGRRNHQHDWSVGRLGSDRVNGSAADRIGPRQNVARAPLRRAESSVRWIDQDLALSGSSINAIALCTIQRPTAVAYRAAAERGYLLRRTESTACGSVWIAPLMQSSTSKDPTVV